MTRQGRTFVVLGSAEMGGSESLGLSLASRLEGPVTIVFMTAAEGPARRRARSLRLDITDCDLSSLGRIRFITAFARLCRKRRATSVLAFMFGVHLLVAVASRMGGVRSVLAFVGNPAPDESRRRDRTRLAARLSGPFVTRIVACSAYVAGSITRSYGVAPRKVAIVQNWCDVDRIAATVHAGRASGPRGDVVGMVARFDPIKNHRLLVEAFARIADRKPDASLRLVGEGPTRPGIEALVADRRLTDRVVFVGAVDDPAVELSGFKVFAFCTTDQEGFGVALAEAMAAGVPIVATDVGPVSETLDGGRGGLMVPDGDEAALAEAILRMLDDEELRGRSIASGMDLVNERYSLDRASQRIAELLRG